MRLFCFAASLRRDSLNRKLLHLAEQAAERAGATLDHADFREFDMPLYDGDVEEASGIPAGAQKLRERFLGCDAFMIVSPEYNYSVPGTLKNAIDWASRVMPYAWRHKPGLLLSASPSLVGGSQGLRVLRVSLEGTGAPLYPETFSLPTAHQAFDEVGALKDAKMAARLDKIVAAFVSYANALAARPK